MIIGAVKETHPGERRVALVPASVQTLIRKRGAEVVIETGAGVAAGYPDKEYESVGAKIAGSRDEVFRSAGIVCQVWAATAGHEGAASECDLLRDDLIVVGQCAPFDDRAAVERAAKTGVTSFALELMPRITRAQAMDILSSQATVAGYRAVLLAASNLPRMFPMMMTAAGTLAPAHVFVVGAGVAGLQAIATSKRLGGVVTAYDIRPAARAEIESMGAKALDLGLGTDDAQDAGGYAKAMDEEFYRKQAEAMTKAIGESDVIITTAAVPGKKAPVLVTAAQVATMRPGSVIVDLAAARGGNCELTRPGEQVVEHGVTILGPANLPSDVPFHASQMFGRNVTSFLSLFIKDGAMEIDFADEIIAGTLLTQEGDVVHAAVREAYGLPAREPVTAGADAAAAGDEGSAS